ncbi:hypothetical protein D3C73_1519350 [compost metagenome]
MPHLLAGEVHVGKKILKLPRIAFGCDMLIELLNHRGMVIVSCFINREDAGSIADADRSRAGKEPVDVSS